jgi:mycothiol synthase
MSDQLPVRSESLIMRRPHLDDLPAAPPLPEGGVLRLAHDDDREGLRILLQTAFPEGDWTPAKVEAALYTDSRVPATFVVEVAGQLVATASALFEPQLQPETGTLHWVAAHPAQSGKGLGALISLAVLQEFLRQGRASALLRTDDSRLPAIRTYLNLGFLPDCSTPARAERWERVYEQLAAHRKE